ncbi:MAG: heavy metal translocating P-type ATPase, partial [Patescibacteria group bacterium]
CASCAINIEKALKKNKGVHAVEVNYGTETAKIAYDPSATNAGALSELISPLGYSLVQQSAESMGMSASEHAAHTGLGVSKQEKLAEVADMKNKVLASIPLTLVSILILTWDMLVEFSMVRAPSMMLEEFFHHLLPIMATYMLFVVGKPYLLGVYRFFRYGSANMDTLIGIGTSVAFFYSFIVTAFEDSLRSFIDVGSTYYDVTIVVIAFITLGKYLEARAKIKTGDAIEKLLNLQAKTALIIKNGTEVEIPITQVVHGDLLVIKPGARIPVDGVITEGETHIDESMVTGEPMPAGKKTGDAVVGGTMNTTGAVTMRATKVGNETLLAHIIKMVEDAQGSRAPIQALADKISGIFVPVVLALAVVTLGVWLLFGTPAFGFSKALSYGLMSFVGILVIACPCALGLATPTAIIVGVGKGARSGILIKDAATLEKLHQVDTIVMDKTGTITKGKPEVVQFTNMSKLSDDEVISIAYALERKSEHPLASAVLTYAKTKSISERTVTNFSAIKGKGVRGTIDGKEYVAGNTTLMTERGLSVDQERINVGASLGHTPIIIASAEAVLAIAMVADAIKPEAIQAIRALHRMGIRTVMLTGDQKRTAEAIAREVGIDEVVAEVLPDDKLRKIQELQRDGHIVAMAGDGINDAPALARADVGIAMATGTDVAIETAGITLLHGDISKLVASVRLSKLTMRGIKQNLFWAFIYNVVGIPIAAGVLYPAFGILLNPVFAGLAMAFSSVSVVGNSLRLKTKKI